MVSLLDLEARGFSPVPWKQLPPQLLAHVAKLEEATRDSGNISKISLNADIVSRGHFQKEQILRFCRSHDVSPLLPVNPFELKEVLKHLLYDDSKKVVFCYVPKNGCSNMKRMLLVLNGYLPPKSVNQSRPAEGILDQVGV